MKKFFKNLRYARLEPKVHKHVKVKVHTNIQTMINVEKCYKNVTLLLKINVNKLIL